MKLFYTNEELPQRSEEWLKVRESCVGGSDVASLLGLAMKFETPKDLWERKTGRRKPKESNAAMERGAELEDEAKTRIVTELREYENISNPNIPSIFAKDPMFDYIGVSFDGVDIDNRYIVEIKCPSYVWNFRSVFENGIQDYYYPQVQLQLFVANAIWGIELAYFCSYFPDKAHILNKLEFKEELKDLCMIPIIYDEDFCMGMLDMIQIFWKFKTEDFWDARAYSKALKHFNEGI